MSYIIQEFQTNDEGQTAIITNQVEDRPHADSAYYTVLASAAISDVPVHSAVILTNDGGYITSKSYDHREPEPEPTPEPEEE